MQKQLHKQNLSSRSEPTKGWRRPMKWSYLLKQSATTKTKSTPSDNGSLFYEIHGNIIANAIQNGKGLKETWRHQIRVFIFLANITMSNKTLNFPVATHLMSLRCQSGNNGIGMTLMHDNRGEGRARRNNWPVSIESSTLDQGESWMRSRVNKQIVMMIWRHISYLT